MNEMYLINVFNQAFPGFGLDPPIGSNLARGSLHLKRYQSLGLGVLEKKKALNDFVK